MSDLWTIDELVKATGGKLVGKVDKAVNGVSIDSRSVGEGDVFIAIRGDRLDGHDYVVRALESGAGLAVVSRTDDAMMAAGPLLVVADPLVAMQDMGKAARARSKARIIAVTGSVGKTSTKDALALALGASGKVHAAVASFNNHWGVPLTLSRMHSDCDYAVFEIGMNHPGEITPLVKMVRPHVAIITTIAEVHLGHFSSLQDIAMAKAEIFDGLEAGGTAILPADSDYFELLSRKASGFEIVGFGKSEKADVRLIKAVLKENSSCVTAEITGEKIYYKLGAPGAHVVANSLAVIAGVKYLGANLAKGLLQLAEIAAPKGRGARFILQVPRGEILLIDESYNANPVSMRAALALLKDAEPGPGGRRIAVLGDMLELGDKSAQLHGELASAVDASGADRVFACGPMMQSMWKQLAVFRRAVIGKKSDELTESLLDELHAGDVVMIKGSLGSAMGPLVEAIKNKFQAGDQAA